MEHITVCICTYKRPNLLKRLLNELDYQRTEGLFDYSIVVVDNDMLNSAQEVVNSFQQATKINVKYCIEPEQNIALARNKAIENAKGEFVAFIDDDEFPIPAWLLELYNAYKKYGSDGVLGPVKPYFDQSPPAWLLKGKFCERNEHPTGTILDVGDTRTGNALLDIRLFEKKEDRFGVEFGRTGGEDVEFFKKMISQGRVFVWCNEAIAYETVPPERWAKSFYIEKYLRFGGLSGEKVRKAHFWPYATFMIKNVFAIVPFTLALPFSLFLGQDRQMKCITKIVYGFGMIAGFLGWVPIRYR